MSEEMIEKVARALFEDDENVEGGKIGVETVNHWFDDRNRDCKDTADYYRRQARAAIAAYNPNERLREALVQCRHQFAGYVEIHKAKLPAGPDAPAPANWRDIALKIERNQEMVAMIDAALSHLPRGED